MAKTVQSSIIGPNVVQAIINFTNNSWTGFPFVFALCAAASIVIWFVDVEKGRENARKYSEDRKLLRAAKESGLTPDQVIAGAATGDLGVTNDSRSDSAEFFGVETTTKGKYD